MRDEALRSGVRYVCADKKGDCKNKPQRKQRKETLTSPVTHSDAVEALISMHICQVACI